MSATNLTRNSNKRENSIPTNVGWVTVEDNKQKGSFRFLLRKKIVETKTPYLQKLIIRFISGNKNGTALFLIRDGFVVKHCRPQDKRHTNFAHICGYKLPIRSRNLGALFEKYNIPKSTGKILVEKLTQAHRFHIHTFCRDFKDLLKFMGESIDNLNKVISYNPYIYRSLKSLDMSNVMSVMDNMSAKRKLDFLCCDYIRDTCWMHSELKEDAPQLLNGFDWTKSVQEIHDSLSLLRQKKRNPRLYEDIPYIKETVKDVEKANNLLGGQLELKLAKNGEDLAKWGNHLHHCIGGYANRALIGADDESLILMGVFEPDKDMPTWCIEARVRGSARRWTILQFRGLYNEQAPEQTIDLVDERLNSENIVLN